MKAHQLLEILKEHASDLLDFDNLLADGDFIELAAELEMTLTSEIIYDRFELEKHGVTTEIFIESIHRNAAKLLTLHNDMHTLKTRVIRSVICHLMSSTPDVSYSLDQFDVSFEDESAGWLIIKIDDSPTLRSLFLVDEESNLLSIRSGFSIAITIINPLTGAEKRITPPQSFEDDLLSMVSDRHCIEVSLL